jgi:hypothetical protein
MTLRSLRAATAVLCASLSFVPAARAASPKIEEVLEFPEGVAGDEAPALSLTGELVDRKRDAVTLEDASGENHTLRLTEQTRYVYGVSSSPSDFRVGARIRAEYALWSPDRVALALWVLGGPTR